jgi:hypothetical protein
LYKNLADGKQRMDAYRDGQVRVQVSWVVLSKV